jgi:hypothetical protein
MTPHIIGGQQVTWSDLTPEERAEVKARAATRPTRAWVFVWVQRWYVLEPLPQESA